MTNNAPVMRNVLKSTTRSTSRLLKDEWTLHRKPCSALQRTATHCNALQRTATHCNALQRIAPHCTALQRTAPHCNALQTMQHRNLFLNSDSTAWEMRSPVDPTKEGICFGLFQKHSLTDSFRWKEVGNTYTVGLQRDSLCREALLYISSLRETFVLQWAIKRPRTRSTAARQVSSAYERDLVTNQNV